MTGKTFLVALLLAGFGTSAQQHVGTANNIGISAQLYPAGFVPTCNFEHFLNERSSLVFRLGLNFTDWEGFSDVNETEEGDGLSVLWGIANIFPWAKERSLQESIPTFGA